MKKLKSLSVIYWIASFEIISYSMGLLTRNNMEWYKLLNKSILTPPAYIFPIVWTILYAILAVSGYFIYIKRSSREIKPFFILFLIQMLFNWSWTPVFFGMHKPNVALAILFLTISCTCYMLIRAIHSYRIIFYLLLPYFCWIVFAGYLNLVICISN